MSMSELPEFPTRKTAKWGSQFGFIMAACGSSVGLGNFWRFPYTAGENGGGIFILAYIVSVIFIALPILMAEYALGRKTRVSAVSSFRQSVQEKGRSPYWIAAGWIGPICAFLILSFYNVIAAWILAFIPQAFEGRFTALVANAQVGGHSPIDLAAANFEATINDHNSMILLLGLFVLTNIVVVSRGIRSGIEYAAKILMPLFFLMLVAMLVYALFIGDVGAAADFIFQPNWSEFGFDGLLAAISQAFFSIGVGVGLMITYGSYLRTDANIPRSAAIVAACDTSVAIIAGMAIFPIVLAFGGSTAAGPGLFFISMPVALGGIFGGPVLGGIFFLLALFAAFTSSISLMEVSVSWLEEQGGINRPGATVGIGAMLFMVGVAYVYSGQYLDFVDFVTEAVLLPLGGIIISLFVGWVVGGKMLVAQLGRARLVRLMLIFLRWIIPCAISLVLIVGLLGRISA